MMSRLDSTMEGKCMRRVLLVDDEGYILELLQEIIDWEFYGFQIVGTAENARDAMKIFYQKDPDIIITDICMDDISGIEFITRIRLQSSKVKIVILSAYDKFEYAQEALKLDVDGYLLKPVKKEELLSIILEIQKKLESKSEYQDKIWHLQSSLDNLKRKYLEEQLIKIYQTGLEPTTNDLDLQGFWAVASIKTIERKEIVFLESDMKALNDVKVYTLFVGDGLFALFLYSTIQNREQIRGALENIKQKYCNNEKSILCGMSSTDENSELSKICEYSRKALNMLFYKNTKYYISNVSLKEQVKSKVVEEASQEQFTLWIVNHEFDQCTEHFMNYLKGCADANVEVTKVIQYFKQCANVIKFYIQQGERTSEFENIIEKSNSVLRVNEIYDLFNRCLKLICEDNINLKKTEVIIANAQDYIRKNCTKIDFSIDLLSKHLDISKSYLSKLYKNVTGESVWSFVIQLRIAKAKEMLINTNSTNFEIAKSIGYTSEYHFSRAFKKNVGVSPSTYKKMYLQKSNI